MRLQNLMLPLTGALVAAFTAGVAFANDPSKSASADAPMTDSEIMSKVHMKNVHEIEMGGMGKTKSTNKDVQKYGQMLIDDHTKADEKVLQLAKKKNIALSAPTDMPADKKAEMDAKHAKLEAAKGMEFDREYLTQMVEGHDKLAMKLKMECERKDAHDKEVLGLMKDLLPTVEKHRDDAKKMLGKLTNSPS